MLRFVFTDVDKNEVVFENPLKLSINMDENVPAHDMSVLFLYEKVSELCDVRVLEDNVIVFSGIVDEQQHLMSSSGEYLKITARSYAARLLDNESVPIGYTHPSTSVVLKNHATPFSINSIEEDERIYYGSQTVKKGYTNWQAIEDFSKKAYGTIPRVNELGEIIFTETEDTEVIEFSPFDDEKSVRYESFVSSIKRCEELSKVKIKAVNSSGYTSVVENEDAIKRSIIRERYLNSVLTETPVVYAQKMIQNAKAKAFNITLKCSGAKLTMFLKNASVTLFDRTKISGLYISSISYSLSKNDDTTTIILKRKGDYNVAS
ncbi:MAG: hypothetical protein IIX27_03075 [Ruminococcus sp.]|nr:hypothetical protein [Ruminococcus sp.]